MSSSSHGGSDGYSQDCKNDHPCNREVDAYRHSASILLQFAVPCPAEPAGHFMCLVMGQSDLAEPVLPHHDGQLSIGGLSRSCGRLSSSQYASGPMIATVGLPHVPTIVRSPLEPSAPACPGSLFSALCVLITRGMEVSCVRVTGMRAETQWLPGHTTQNRGGQQSLFCLVPRPCSWPGSA